MLTYSIMLLAAITSCLSTKQADILLLLRLCVQLNNLYDMQHMWYEVRCGDAHLSAGQLGKALKKYTAVAKHFSDFAGKARMLRQSALLQHQGGAGHATPCNAGPTCTLA